MPLPESRISKAAYAFPYLPVLYIDATNEYIKTVLIFFFLKSLRVTDSDGESQSKLSVIDPKRVESVL
jgi:hypothetical protein